MDTHDQKETTSEPNSPVEEQDIHLDSPEHVEPAEESPSEAKEVNASSVDANVNDSESDTESIEIPLEEESPEPSPAKSSQEKETDTRNESPKERLNLSTEKEGHADEMTHIPLATPPPSSFEPKNNSAPSERPIPPENKPLPKLSPNPTGNRTWRKIDTRHVKANLLSVEEQKEADKPLLEAVHALFANQFHRSQTILESYANEDPLYALGLAALGFTNAMMSNDKVEVNTVIEALTNTFYFAKAQISAVKPPLNVTISNYFSTAFSRLSTKTPSDSDTATNDQNNGASAADESKVEFLSNGALRAYTVSGACSLALAIIYYYKELSEGKMWFNFVAAFKNYHIVWLEYQRMGESAWQKMDPNTLSAVHFGVGILLVLLDSLPSPLARVLVASGLKGDKHTGLHFLRQCSEVPQQAYAPLASLVLLMVYTNEIECSPSFVRDIVLRPAREILSITQQRYHDSLFVLYFAGILARSQKRPELSRQLFDHANEVDSGHMAVDLLAMQESMWNDMMALEWSAAIDRIKVLEQSRFGSLQVLRYLYAGCVEMMGDRAEAILMYVDIFEQLEKKTDKTMAERFVYSRVQALEHSGFRDIDISVPLIEMMYIWNLFPSMSRPHLEACLGRVEHALVAIIDYERRDYEMRTSQLAPSTPPPTPYYSQRGILLLVKAGLLNALGRHRDTFEHLNWIIDCREVIMKQARWVIAFTYWEAGVTSWYLGNRPQAQNFWETVTTLSNYGFERRLSMALRLAQQMIYFIPQQPGPTVQAVNTESIAETSSSSQISGAGPSTPRSSNAESAPPKPDQH